MNDLPNVLLHCKLTFYADDTILHLSSGTVYELETWINSDLDRVSNKLRLDHLSLNVKKSVKSLRNSS